MELFEVIRNRHFVQGQSIRQVARELKVHRRLVRQALSNAIPPARQVARRGRKVLSPSIQYLIQRTIRYDNLTSAVKKVLRGRARQETERFIGLRSHYLFESFFCRVGITGAHEKGGVEGGVGRLRRSHLTPVPVS